MKPIDYSKTIMYKLVPKDLNLNLQYVGHTTNFRCRKNGHKSRCSNTKDKCYNFKVYEMIRANGGWDEWVMIEIEKYPCNDKNEACKRERELMEEFNSNLNMIKSINFKEDIIAKSKKWREKNKDKINAKQYVNYHKNINETIDKRKEWCNKNRDKINATAKKCREKNKDAINAKAREYHEKNRDVINAKLRERRLQKKLEALKLEENSVGV